MKLVKNYYYDKNGNKKLNGYLIHLSKKDILQANINDNNDMIIYVENNKIVIEEKKGN